MPLSLYQIRCAGYWLWGNYVPPALFPTLNGTLLTPGGMFALAGFFGGQLPPAYGQAKLTAADAALNLTLLGLCSLAALTLLERVLAFQARRA